MKKNKELSTKRGRNWVIIVYPDSAPEDWKRILEEEICTPALVAYHDKDRNPTGEPKKPHFHVLLMFEGNKSFEQIQAISDRFSGVMPQSVQSVKGMARYLAHMDNPEKHQYSIEDIEAYGGADKVELLKPSKADKYTMIGEMMDFIEEYEIDEMRDLLLYARRFKIDTWFPLLCDNSSYVISKYIESSRCREKQGQKVIGNQIYDTETGELIKELHFLDSREEDNDGEIEGQLSLLENIKED